MKRDIMESVESEVRIMKRSIREFVGSRIRSIRLNKNLTQKELGEKVGVKHNTISSYEKGTNEPEQDVLFRLANTLNVSINYFFPYEENLLLDSTQDYTFFPAHVSAGLPNEVDGITQSEKISISDTIMGKYAGNKDIYITKINGDSMNRVIPDQSLIAVRPVSLESLKDGDIVVYSRDGEYAVKRYFNFGEEIEFRPDSHDKSFRVDTIQLDNDIDLKIKGKVVLYIVELD